VSAFCSVSRKKMRGMRMIRKPTSRMPDIADRAAKSLMFDESIGRVPLRRAS
jgi:hypothetical protein